MRYTLLLLFLLPFAAFAQTVTGSLNFDNTDRNYRLFVPSDYDPNGEPLPLVFNLHGFTSNALAQEVYSNMSPVADTAGFLVCYPNGVASQWNVGWSFNLPTDDVGFIDTLIDHIAADYNVDLNRVYSCGMSNGGYMSYRLACELSDRIAAVASVTGSMAPGDPYPCDPPRTVPVMQVHGTDDGTVPYNGDPNIAVPIEEVLDFWLDKNDCPATADTTAVPDLDPNDGTTSQRIEWTGCADDTDVLFFKVENGGHTWPGSPINIGVTSQDFDASTEIWAFFNRYSLDGVISSTRPAVETPTWSLLPNPATEVLFIRDLRQAATAELYDARGLLQRTFIAEPNAGLSVAELPAGWYFVRVRTENGAWSTQRFLKQ